MRTYGIFKSSCPTGWTLESDWVDKFLMGSNAAGTTGGTLAHNHGGTVSLPSDGSNYATSVNKLPPYITVIFCEKEQE